MRKRPIESPEKQPRSTLCGTNFIAGSLPEAKEPESLDDFLIITPRRYRYRMAGKSLRFEVYRAMENYLLASVVLALLQAWLAFPWLASVVSMNSWVVAAVGLAHNFKLVSQRPWLIMAAAFEGWAVWAIFTWGLAKYVTIPYLEPFCVFVAVWRYWGRGEDVVDELAYREFVENESRKGAQPE